MCQHLFLQLLVTLCQHLSPAAVGTPLRYARCSPRFLASAEPLSPPSNCHLIMSASSSSTATVGRKHLASTSKRKKGGRDVTPLFPFSFGAPMAFCFCSFFPLFSTFCFGRRRTCTPLYLTLYSFFGKAMPLRANTVSTVYQHHFWGRCWSCVNTSFGPGVGTSRPRNLC